MMVPSGGDDDVRRRFGIATSRMNDKSMEHIVDTMNHLGDGNWEP